MVESRFVPRGRASEHFVEKHLVFLRDPGEGELPDHPRAGAFPKRTPPFGAEVVKPADRLRQRFRVLRWDDAAIAFDYPSACADPALGRALCREREWWYV